MIAIFLLQAVGTTIVDKNCGQQFLSKKHKDNIRYEAQNILVLKFLKESALENNIVQAQIIFASFITEHNDT